MLNRRNFIKTTVAGAVLTTGGTLLSSCQAQANEPKKNDSIPYKPEAEDQVRGFCEDGMFLGDWISKDVGLVKTFLSRNELKVNQRTEYYGAMLNWIIGDMYMVRSGGSLTLEEFDKLPDEWFSIQTWRAFVASRGNPMWNNLLIDYVTFRKEHPKEYKLCSDMLERIADNRILDEE